MAKPTASPRHWPYREHRTVEQVDFAQAKARHAIKARWDNHGSELEIEESTSPASMAAGSSMLLAALRREARAL